MKKTQRKDAVRNIRKRIASYLSVCLVIVLGIGGMLTTRYMEAGLDNTSAEFYENQKFKDFELISSLGVSDASIEKIRTLDDVVSAEGVLQVDGSADFRGDKANITLISLTESVSIPDVIEGRVPKAKNECIIGEDFAGASKLKVGDKLRLTVSGLDMSSSDALGGEELFDENESAADDDAADTGEDEQGEDEKTDDSEKPASALVEKEFIITGLMRHPDYMRRLSANIVSVVPEAFNKEVTKGLYTKAYVRITQPEGVSPLSDKYFEETDDTKKKLEELAKQLKAERSQEVKDEAYARIDKEWADAEQQLAEAQAQIDSGETELNKRLAEGATQLNRAESTLESKVDEYNRKLKNGSLKVPEYNKTIKQLEKELKSASKSLDEAEELFSEDLVWKKEIIEYVDFLLENMPLDGTPTTIEELAIANLVIENEDAIREYLKKFNDQSSDMVKKMDKYTDVDLKKSYETIKALDVDLLIEESKKVKDSAENGNYGGTYHYSEELLRQIKAAIKAIDDIEKAVKDAKKQVAKAKNKLANGKKKAKQKIRSEAVKGRKKIAKGWDLYYSEKAKYENQLEEAKSLLSENREEAEKKLAEIKAKVETITCEWIVLDRRGNEGYMDMRSNLLATRSMGIVFGLLFSIITAIVCFSTLVIMIDEQKKLVGTCKAFGFHKREVLGKYMVFGLSSAVVGSILAAITAYILTVIVQHKLGESGMYTIGTAESTILIRPTLLAALFISLVTVAATVFACSDILRSPASLLMSGGVLKKQSTRSTRKSASRKGSLYSRLIIRNMLDDKARVLVSIAVIAFSCMLIGLGISMKAAFDGMVNRQINDVNRYDFRVDMNDEATDTEEAKIINELEKNDLEYLPAAVEMKLYVWGGKVDGLQMICADPDRISGFYGIQDPETGKEMSMPEDGILIQKRMHESYDMSAGDKLPVLGNDLSISEVEIKGYFTNYAGRAVVLTPEAYEKAFHVAPENRSFFVKLDGKNRKDIEKQLLSLTDNITISEDDEFKTKFESAMNLYNLLVIVVTAIAIFISFMILTNLANIYLARKKTELSVMRVNGFSIRQTKAYLVRESIFTTLAGIVLGVLIGAMLTPILIQSMQQPDLEFVKSFQPVAWIAAAGIEAVFSILINYVVFRKVKDLNLRDIAG